MGAASFAAVGAAIADLVSTVTGKPPAVRVDRTLASVWLAYWSEPVGWDRGTPWHGVSTDYPAADGRWVRLQANYDHLRRAAAKALGATEDREAFARAIAAMTADEAEHAIVTGGGGAAATRTLDEWAAHPQGQAAAAEPLIDTTFGDGAFGSGLLAGVGAHARSARWPASGCSTSPGCSRGRSGQGRSRATAPRCCASTRLASSSPAARPAAATSRSASGACTST